MKFWHICAAALAVAVGAGLLLGRKKEAEPPPVDGGVRKRIDTGAPKVIRSAEITQFHCAFSAADRCRGDTPLAGGIFTLHAEERAAQLHIRGRSEIVGEYSFCPEEAFFRRLQQVVSQYDFAQYNGVFYTVSGLPPDLGMKLRIRYASGESICASNNQSTFLPLEAMQELVALFQDEINKSGGI